MIETNLQERNNKSDLDKIERYAFDIYCHTLSNSCNNPDVISATILSRSSIEDAKVFVKEISDHRESQRYEMTKELADEIQNQDTFIGEKPEQDLFVSVARKFMEFSLKTFTKATPESCFKHLEKEIEEFKKEVSFPDRSNMKEICTELADCISVLLSIAARCGIRPEEIVSELGEKTEINILRRWSYNGDGTYRHIKDSDCIINLEEYVSSSVNNLSSEIMGKSVNSMMKIGILDKKYKRIIITIPSRFTGFGYDFLEALFSDVIRSNGEQGFINKYIFSFQNDRTFGNLFENMNLLIKNVLKKDG